MKNLLLVFVILSIPGTLAGQDQAPPPIVETGTMTVRIEGFKNTQGQLMVSLYKNDAQFHNKTACKGRITIINAKQELIRFENVPYGDYAVVVLHDMNKDGKLDTNAFGIPTEGYGFSNNAMAKFGPPSWLQSRFVFDEQYEDNIIKLKYGISF
jgi:uncharacterized protein (DUF2141 family)